MTPLTREETERLRRLADWQDALCENCDRGDDEAECICLDKPPHEYPIRPETLRELLRGYEAWREAQEKIDKRRRFVVRPDHPMDRTPHERGYRMGLDDGFRFAIDALRAGERKP